MMPALNSTPGVIRNFTNLTLMSIVSEKLSFFVIDDLEIIGYLFKNLCKNINSKFFFLLSAVSGDT